MENIVLKTLQKISNSNELEIIQKDESITLIGKCPVEMSVPEVRLVISLTKPDVYTILHGHKIQLVCAGYADMVPGFSNIELKLEDLEVVRKFITDITRKKAKIDTINKDNSYDYLNS
jgi:hypothetical protein